MTAWEHYLENAAAADAMAWWHGLTDEDRVNHFVDRGPAGDACDAWIDSQVEQQMLEAWERDRDEGVA